MTWPPSTQDLEYVGGGAVIGASLGYLWRKKTGLLVGAVLGAVAGWLVEKYLPTGELGPKPGPLPGNPNYVLGTAGTAKAWVSGLESVPVVGNVLAQEFAGSYDVGYAYGQEIKSVASIPSTIAKDVFGAGEAAGKAVGSFLRSLGI